MNNEKKHIINPINRIKSKKMRVLVYCILIFLILIIVSKMFFKPVEQFNYEEVAVKKGDINVVIEGSGVVTPNNQYNITALVQGDILEDHFEEGQLVNKDDLLYVVESEDLQTSISRALLALERAQSAYDLTLQTSELTANANGTIVNSNLKLGQSIMAGQKIAEILDNTNLRLVVQFNSIDVKDMYVGQIVEVIIENTFYTTTGVIAKISSNEVIDLSGITNSYVELNVINPGGLQETDYAIAKINGITSNNSNTFEYVNKSIIYSTGSGYIKEINKLDGDYVTKGTVIASIGNNSIDAQIKQAKLNLDDAKLALENTKNQLKNYNITSPITGKVLVKNNKAGDVLSAGTSLAVANPLAIIADMDKIVFTMKVDELDISKVQVGQKVIITADAVEDKEYIGTVDNINIVGTSQNGVTTYLVKVVINEPEGLLPGMNVDSEIQIVSVNDVLIVPLSAVKRGNIVYVKQSNSLYQDENENVPKGYKSLQVEIGQNDKNYIEIVSGLNEGDIVLVEKAKESSIMDFMSNMTQNSPMQPMQ